MPTAMITNPNLADGYTTLDAPEVTIEKKTSAAVTAKTVVAIGTTSLVAMAATNGTASLQLGVALRAIGSGKTGTIVTQGVVENVPCDGSVAAGDRLKRSVTTTGSVAATATPAAGEVIGVAIAASASNVCTMYVCKSLATS